MVVEGMTLTKDVTEKRCRALYGFIHSAFMTSFPMRYGSCGIIRQRSCLRRTRSKSRQVRSHIQRRRSNEQGRKVFDMLHGMLLSGEGIVRAGGVGAFARYDLYDYMTRYFDSFYAGGMKYIVAGIDDYIRRRRSEKMGYGNFNQSEVGRKSHDEEWGVPVHDDRRLFEFLVLAAMRCGFMVWPSSTCGRE